GFFRDVRRMIVEDQLDRGLRRIRGIQQLEEFYELSTAVTVFDERMDLAGEQINPGQQAQRALTFVFMITREGGVDAGYGRQIGRRCCNGLDSRFFIIGHDSYRLARFPRFGSFFQDLDLTINAQNLRHLLFELGVAPFQIVPHLVWLDFLVAEDFADGALGQLGKTFVPRRRRVLACMPCQEPRRPQRVRITVILGLVASQRYQPRFRLGCNRRLLAGARPIIKRHQWAIGQRPLHAALNRLMMQTQSLPDSEERGLLTVRKQYLRPLHSPRRFASRAGNSCQVLNLFVRHRQFDCLPPVCHAGTPRSIRYKQESTTESPVPTLLVSWNRSSSEANLKRIICAASACRNLKIQNPHKEAPYAADSFRAGCSCSAALRSRLHGPRIWRGRWGGRPDLRGENPSRIPR